MTYEDFRRLIMDASEFDNLDAYIAEVGGSVPTSVPDTKVIQLLTDCYTYGRSHTAATIRGLTSLSQAAFARAYLLPARTVENWEGHGASARTAPPYVLDLLAYAVITSKVYAD